VRGFLGVLLRGVAYSVEARARYGDVYRVPFIGNPMVVVWDADEIAKIFRNEEHVWSTAMGWDALMFEKLDPRKGNIGTLLSLDFEEHLVARKLVQPGFTLKAIEGYLAVAGRAFDTAIGRWLARGEVDFKPAIRKLLADVALEIFTGLDDRDEIALVDRALSDFWGGMMSIARNPIVSPTFRRAQRGLETLIRTFLALVPVRRRDSGTDLFSRMCQAEDEDGLGDDAAPDAGELVHPATRAARHDDRRISDRGRHDDRTNGQRVRQGRARARSIVMALKLYGHDPSPFVRRVRILAAELGLPLERDAHGWLDPVAEFTNNVPTKRVPMLDRGPEAKERYVFESRVIASLLYDEAGKIPRPDVQSTLYAPALDFADHNMLSAIDTAQETIIHLFLLERDGLALDKGLYLPRQAARIDECLHWANTRYEGRTTLTPGKLAWVDICVVSMIGWCRFRNRADVNRWPNLVAVETALKDRPSFASTVPV